MGKMKKYYYLVWCDDPHCLQELKIEGTVQEAMSAAADAGWQASRGNAVTYCPVHYKYRMCSVCGRRMAYYRRNVRRPSNVVAQANGTQCNACEQAIRTGKLNTQYQQIQEAGNAYQYKRSSQYAAIQDSTDLSRLAEACLARYDALDVKEALGL